MMHFVVVSKIVREIIQLELLYYSGTLASQ
jgi:hypothetical protein